ncbi:hypothetical protein F5B21DRAFT_503506 [Xylaria acuta]|nr:hypothetical protein F5B21DRAFT_503506 [Xylaria acuta]
MDVNQAQARADIEKLKKFSAKSLKDETAEVTQTSATWMNRGLPRVSHELDDDIERLCNTLKQHRTCTTGGPHRDIIINIRLDGYRTIVEKDAPAEFIVDNASAEFGVLFLEPPTYRGVAIGRRPVSRHAIPDSRNCHICTTQYDNALSKRMSVD